MRGTNHGRMFLAVFVLFYFAICTVTSAQQPRAAAQTEPKYAVLDPRGDIPEGDLIPLAPRVSDLNDKVVYIVSSWEKDTGFENILLKAEEMLKKRFPKVTVVWKTRGTANYSSDDPALWKEMQSKGQAFIYAGAPSSSTTNYAFIWSAGLEKGGLPGTILVYNTLLDVAKGARERLATPIRYTAVPFPIDSMTEKQQSDIVNSIIASLMAPLVPEEKKTGKYIPPKRPGIAFTGNISQVQDYFYKQGWTDGLPIILPTEEKVSQMLKGTKHAAKEVLTSSMYPEKLKVTVEKVAINGVMAGCKPEDMPVLLAAIEAYTKRNMDSTLRSTGSFAFMHVVNGPIRKELKMNAGTFALGPGNEANAAIGRALRLFIINLGGGRPDVNMMGVIGNTAYTFCFPENEERSPWAPFSVDQGFKAGESTLTFFTGGWAHTGNYGYTKTALMDVAKDISVFEYPSGAVILIAPPRADMLKAEGMSKEAVKEYI